jgi:hypothetical protein
LSRGWQRDQQVCFHTNRQQNEWVRGQNHDGGSSAIGSMANLFHILFQRIPAGIHFESLLTGSGSIQRLYELDPNQLQFARAFLPADSCLDGRGLRRNARVGPRGGRRSWDRQVQRRVGIQGPRTRQQSACRTNIQSLDQVEEDGARGIDAADKEWNLQSHPRRTAPFC